MEFFSNYGTETVSSRKLTVTIQKKALELFHQIGRLTHEIQKNNYFDLKMQQADWPLLGTEFQILLGLLGLLTAIIFFFCTLDVFSIIIGLFCGIAIGVIILKIRIHRRQNAFSNQLSDMLKMIADAMRSGYSFMQAMEYISNEMNPPASREVELLIRETNLNVPLETALEHMTQRLQNKDFELVVTAVLIQRQIGGNLSHILDTISVTINDRIKMRREIRTLTAQGRLSGIILAILPLALGALIYIVNPDYLRPLFENEIGYYAIVIALILELIGFIIIRKIIDIDM
ncbi:MAG: type II secretion system F family protein [Anaerovibrio sp.]|uniref:type II secretion system F family protein n=1 Tax=Anaerovibrio sp. TaxID=1872532 RepID=UPI0025E3E47E|nr:type II secretion system F family protein [Anaerovibrio sp.]MCR5177121.1 type II secretion system F family protein [Anaerovibrio sp.]